MTAKILAFALLLLGTSIGFPLHAAIMGTDSVEWLTCSAQIVAVGTVKEIKFQKGPGDVVYEDCVFKISEMIKGPPDKEVSFTYRHLGRSEDSWKKPDQGLLVFLSAWQDHYTDEQARLLTDPYHETRMHKRLVPTRGSHPFSVITLADLTKYLFDKDAHRISDKQALLSLCRQWAGSPVTHSIQEKVEFGTDVFKSLYAMSAVFLMVPAEEKHRLLFLQNAKSEDPGLRQQAAANLWKFSGDESETALRSLFSDTTERIWYRGSNEIDHIEYDVRTAAFNSLKQLGKTVPNLPLQRQPTAEEQHKYREQKWRATFKRSLPEGWTVAAVREGEVRNQNSRDWTIVEIELTHKNDKCTLRLVPQPFGTNSGEKMKFLGIRDPYSDSSHYLYATPSIAPDLEKQLISHLP